MTKQLDPLPYVHDCWDDGTCSDYGKRKPARGINNEFAPRPEYEQDKDQYDL